MLYLPGDGMAQKGAGFGLYNLMPNINMMLVYQDDARVLPWCLEQTQNPFVYCGYLFVACMYLWIIFWLIFPFCCFFGNWYFGSGLLLFFFLFFLCVCAHLYIFFTVNNLSGTVNKFHLAQKCLCE